MRRFALLTTLTLFACALAAPAAPARLAVVANGKTQVKVVDLGRKKVVARPDVGLPARAVALSLDGLRAYVVASGSTAGRLAAIDLVSRTVVASVPVPPGARGVAIAPDGSRAYVTSGGRQGKVTVDRPRHRRDRRRDRDVAAPCRDRPVAGRLARVRDQRQAQAGAGRRRRHAQREDDQGRDRTRSPWRSTPPARACTSRTPAAIACRSSTPALFRSAGVVRVGRPIGGIALSPNGQRALVGPGRRSRKAVVISPRRGKRIRRISAGRGPTFVAFSPTGARIYFANSGSGTITFASGYSYRRLPGRVRVGRRITGMAAQSGLLARDRHAGPGHPEGRPRPGPRARAGRRRHAERLSRQRRRRGR